MTEKMIDALHIVTTDRVVEFAPGLGATARRTLSLAPASYTAVERDAKAAAMVRKILQGDDQSDIVGQAEETGWPSGSATVVYGETWIRVEFPATEFDFEDGDCLVAIVVGTMMGTMTELTDEAGPMRFR